MYVLLLIAVVAAAYQLLALAACLRQIFSRRRLPPHSSLPPISILKPVRGIDPGFDEAIRSHARQIYPEFEILCGVADPKDPAIPEIKILAEEFPHVPIRIIVGSLPAANRKVGVLMAMQREARHPIVIVNDADVRVPPDYLRQIATDLADPNVGLVTCLYRASAHSWPARWEALGIATDFVPGAMVAPFVGVNEFGLGATLAARAPDIARIGGFAAIADYIADDYQLGAKIHALGLRCVLSPVVVETSLSGKSWRRIWRHQLRWARTIRVSRFGGYLGLPITHATLWALVAALCGQWTIAGALLALRLTMALVSGIAVLGSPAVARYFYLIPFRDLWGVALWIAGLFGDTVDWRGGRLRLNREGKILA